MASPPAAISDFVKSLSGYEVWLIGSRANGTARENSDWDLLVFGSADLLARLEGQSMVEDVDVLVVVDRDRLQSPWKRTTDGVVKSGSLAGWKWTRKSEREATYEGTKWPDDWGSPRRAVRIGGDDAV